MKKLLCVAIATLLLSITMTIQTESVAEPISVTETTTEFIETTTEPPRNIMTVTATAYCSCVKCCGKNDGITASGVKAKANHTIAVDRKVIPLGTHIIYNDIEYVAEDTGGAIKGNRIDIYFDSHSDALEFGRQKVEIEVLL